MLARLNLCDVRIPSAASVQADIQEIARDVFLFSIKKTVEM